MVLNKGRSALPSFPTRFWLATLNLSIPQSEWELLGVVDRRAMRITKIVAVDLRNHAQAPSKIRLDPAETDYH